MTRIACIGEAMIELSMADQDPQVGVAGDTLNSAIYLKRSAPDLEIDYISCLGDDPFSDRILAFIDAQGIGTSKITRLPGASPGLYAITTTPEGERSFTYWRSDAAARKLFTDQDFSPLNEYDAVYLSGISVAILPQNVRLAFLDWLAEASIKVIYDSNYRPRLWESKKVAQQITTALWQRTDIALPSIDDEMSLFQETEDQVEQRFISLNCVGALKCGADGPISLGSAVDQIYPSAPQVVDTTAAGDSFNGGYLGALLSGSSQQEALLRGHMLAASVVQHRGAIIPK